MTAHGDWIAELIGKPFILGGRGPQYYDCWGLVREGLRRGWGLEVPALTGAELWDLHARIQMGFAEADDLFLAVDDPRVGDVLVIDLGEHHVGLVVSDEFMLHTTSSSHSRLSRWRRQPWSSGRIAVFRHRALSGYLP